MRRKKIIFNDIADLVENFEEHFSTYDDIDDSPLRLIKAIFSFYSEYIDGQKDKSIDLIKNRPEILRSELIRKYRGQEPDDSLFFDYKTHKGIVNKTLKKLIAQSVGGKILNPKCLVLAKATRGKGEYANYFVSIMPAEEKKAEKIKDAEKKDDIPKPQEIKEKLDSYIKDKTSSISRHYPSLEFYISLNCAETIYSRKSDIELKNVTVHSV